MESSVTIYTSPSCAFCHQAIDYFKSKNVPFETKDITVDVDAYNFVVNKVGQAVTPIITIDGHIIVGYEPSQIDAALADVKNQDLQKKES